MLGLRPRLRTVLIEHDPLNAFGGADREGLAAARAQGLSHARRKGLDQQGQDQSKDDAPVHGISGPLRGSRDNLVGPQVIYPGKPTRCVPLDGGAGSDHIGQRRGSNRR